MKTPDAVQLLSALAHEARLQVFRLLVAAPRSAGDLAQALDMPPSTLSLHLKDLRVAGLVETRREGRQIVYSANLSAVTALVSFLADDCCGGRPDLCLTGASPMTAKTYDVLFLCTGNSARSILAEAVLNAEGGGRFRAHSAGSHPRGQVDPHARDLLERAGYSTAGLRSKSWEEFAGPDAPVLDFVFTVCDDAAGETCPVWPGQPMTAHWGVPDPVAFRGDARQTALFYADVFRMLSTRIGIFTQLPFRALDRLALQRELDAIGTTTEAHLD